MANMAYHPEDTRTSRRRVWDISSCRAVEYFNSDELLECWKEHRPVVAGDVSIDHPRTREEPQ